MLKRGNTKTLPGHVSSHHFFPHTPPSHTNPSHTLYQSICSRLKYKRLAAVVASGNQSSFVASIDEKDLTGNHISKEHLKECPKIFLLSKQNFFQGPGRKLGSRSEVNQLVPRTSVAHCLLRK